ncbi:DUF1684 domain-containing protein [Streptomyces flavofungini]|uniref:DUF1684 domain-containing protein n=1 Tax=Streptomyces flavofungini TaxID=68200 RepID=A0ABS0XHW6_9ACTN|nr:DUF1684 domain-containing protein [Streptomyces flavofungini]MBJ3812819.1 DUF1684 domain-containing protein [Streptomyces flavofungini]GHC79500.1 hypothetical protein GCM10010349_61510 [Streptomyces flavofungini]
MSTTEDALRDFKEWHELRTATVSAPYGPLALTGTHWLADHPDGTLPGLPGHWSDDGDELVLRAAADDRLTLDGQPFTGTARLTPDPGPVAAARLGLGERRLVVLRREGLWAVRDFDPDADARRAFTGIEVTDHDPCFAVEGRFTPYERDRTVRVGNADGVRRGLGLGGELAFTLAGQEQTLQVSVEGDGSLWAVFADGTSGVSSYRFRFLRPAAPDEQGRTRVDFNRALLPPCAFADHFICPFPPPGNTLAAEIPAGERNLSRRRHV